MSLEVVDRIVKLKKAGRFWKGRCPFHNEGGYEFIFNPKKDTWRCFGACNAGGDMESFLRTTPIRITAERIED